jgi:solute carrier family 45 protein 1/2/4
VELHPSPNVAPRRHPINIPLREIRSPQQRISSTATRDEVQVPEHDEQAHPALEDADDRRMSSSDADYFSRQHPSVEGTANNKPSKKSGKKPSALKGGKARDGSIDDGNNGGRGQPAGDEQSPLLSPAREDDGFINNQAMLDDYDAFQSTKSIWYLILLTISIGGLQIAWSVELSNGSPYLLSLGLSKSLMALVWIAGPLSGTLVQPYVGMLSDNCRLRWGKRKPFMLGGAAATICSLMFLAWTKEIVTGVLGLFGADPESDGVKITVICIAVLWVYILDFAINTGMSRLAVLCLPRRVTVLTICPVQAAIRAFIVDCAPAHQQGKNPSAPTILVPANRRI